MRLKKGKKMIKVLVFVYIIIQIEAQFSIKTNISVCDKTDTILTTNSICNKFLSNERILCIDYYNQLNLLLKFDDEYNVLNTILGEIIVYTKNGEIYNTECKTIYEFFIPEKVDRCTKHLPVYFTNESNAKIFAFLTKEGILRKYSEEIQCNNDFDFYQINNFELIKQGTLIGYAEKNIKRQSFDEKLLKIKKNIDIFGNILNSLIEFYLYYIENCETTKIIRDLMTILNFFIILLIIVRSKKFSLKLFSILIDFFSKKKNKVLNDDKKAVDEFKQTIIEMIKPSTLNENIEKEINNIKKLGKVKSNINVIVDTISEHPNVNTRNKKKTHQMTTRKDVNN
jgi:hypothetical protein